MNVTDARKIATVQDVNHIKPSEKMNLREKRGKNILTMYEL